MADGQIKIEIEVDGKQVTLASKELDKLEEAGLKSGKGIKAAESSMDSLSDKSAKAGSSVKGAGDAIEGLGDSGSKAGKDLKGADSAIDGLSDSSADAARSVKGASDSLDDMSGKAGEAAKGAKSVKDETDGMGEKTQKASISLKSLATSLGLVAIASAAFNTLKQSLDSAISRFDTLNKFPKVLQALGVSAEDSERAMQKLSSGIDGLPTTLDDIAASALDMYTSFGDMDKATDTAIALNNALLGSGASADQAKRGTQQYNKTLQTGKLDMMTWNTLSETMGVGLIKIAEEFGYAGKSAKNDLYKALQDGTITFDQFNDKLIEVGTGTGIMAKLAKENSLGIATSLGNLKNAAARGIANIIDSFNKLSIAVTGNDIAQNIDNMKVAVNTSFSAIQKIIEATIPFFQAFGSTIKATIPVVQALSPVLIGLATAYASYVVISKMTAAIQASNAVLTVAMTSSKALTLATQAQMATQIASTTATKADIVAKAAQTGAVNLSTLAIGVMTGQLTLSAAATAIQTAATYALGAAVRFLMGPVGWIITAIGLLTAGVIALVKWFKSTTEEANRLNAEGEKLGESMDSLSNSVSDTSDAYKKNQSEIAATARANEELANKIDELAGKEKKSAAEKEVLNSYIEQLNGSIDGLNLAYDEEANKLSLSSEQLKARIDLMKEQETAQEAQARLTEILKEQAEVEAKLKESNALREEWNQKLEEGSVRAGEKAKAVKGLKEQEDELNGTLEELQAQQKATEEQMTASIEAITEATKNGVSNQKIAFDDLSESQQSTVESMKSTWEDYKEKATDMFDTLSDKSEISVNKMTKNLEENQRIITNWSENIAKLAERGVDEGLLETLRAAGPESAGHVNALVKASDSELDKLSTAFAKGGDTATNALSKSLGIKESGVLDAIGHLVTDTESSLKQQIDAADFKSIGKAVPEGLADGIKGGSKNAESASKKMSDDTTKASKQALGVNSPSRVFKEIGTNITEGLALGINQGTSKVIQAIQKMFNAVETNSSRSFNIISQNYASSVRNIEATLDKLPVATQKSMNNALERLKSGADAQINTMKSLSKSLDNSFKTIVKNYDSSVNNIDKSLAKLPVSAKKSMDSMLERLKTGASTQVQAMRKLAKDLISPFDNINSKFNNIGRSAMSGLNSGLLAGRAQVLATARSIANSVASTMKSALEIHSPSRVMRDDVGKWIPEGIALGIKENAKAVYKELDFLSHNMIMRSTPEQALGASRMAHLSGGFQVGGKGSSITNHNNKSYAPNITNYFTPAESTPSESARKQKQQQIRLGMEWGFR